jgi:PhnB protein
MQLITYVTFAGNCEEALNFYKDVLNAEVLQISYMGDGQYEVPEHAKGKVMHARLKIGENVLYMSDTFDPASVKQGNNVSLSLEIEDTAKLDTLFTKLSAGGSVKMPLEDTFWGARFGMFIDKFGIHWMMNCQLKKEPSLN